DPDRISQLLSAYVDGELSARQLCALDDLLAQSPEGQALLEKLQADAAQLRGLSRQGAPDELAERISDALAHKLPRTPLRLPLSERTVPTWVGLPAAAVVLTAVFCGSFWYFSEIGR